MAEHILQLQALRRDNIPKETLWSWYREFLRLGWQKKDFDKAIERVKGAKIYGAIDFYQFLDAEKTFTETEVELMLKRRIEQIIRNGERLIDEHNLEVTINGELKYNENELKAIRTAIMRRVMVYVGRERELFVSELYERILAQLQAERNSNNTNQESLT